MPKEREDLFSKRIVKICKQEYRTICRSDEVLPRDPAMQHKFPIEGYESEKYAKGTVVDVGGGHGAIVFRLAGKYPEMKIIVQDRPEVIARAPKPEKGQAEFQAYDFFTQQKVNGAEWGG